VLFRAQSFAAARQYFKGIVAFRGGGVEANAWLLVILAVAAVLAIDIFVRRTRATSPGRRTQHPLPTGVTVGAMVAAIIVFSGAAPQPFIYFQF
jgi:hypothetical protein